MAMALSARKACNTQKIRTHFYKQPEHLLNFWLQNDVILSYAAQCSTLCCTQGTLHVALSKTPCMSTPRQLNKRFLVGTNEIIGYMWDPYWAIEDEG